MEDVELWAILLLDGKTFQDLLDMQSEPGEYVPKPSWAVHPRKSGTGGDSKEGVLSTYYLDMEAEYVLAVGSYGPFSLWYCAPPMLVVEG